MIDLKTVAGLVIAGAICITTVVLFTALPSSEADPEPDPESIDESGMFWRYCSDTGSKWKYTVSMNMYSPSTSGGFCQSLVDHGNLSRAMVHTPTMVSIENEKTDRCVYDILNQVRDDTSYESKNLGYRNVNLGLRRYDDLWRWDSDDPSVVTELHYTNWENSFLPDSVSECAMAELRGETFREYGWYQTNCSVPQYMICRDCAPHHYYLNGCFKECDQTAYDPWVVSCDDIANQALTAKLDDDFECKFHVKNADTEDHACMGFPEDYGISDLGGLQFDRLKIDRIHSNAFNGVALGQVTSIDLSGNELDTLPAAVFAGMTAMKTLVLEQNSITHLTNETFGSLPSLSDLRVTENVIEMIGDGTFSSMPSLHHLHLQYNALVEPPKLSAIFGQLVEQLQTCNLTSNVITAITGAHFSKATALKYLGLGNNKLQKLTKESFAGMETIQLNFLDLSNNLIEEIEDASLAGFNSARMQWISLRNNQISQIGASTLKAYSSHPMGSQLEYLDLSHNKIRSIEGGSFSWYMNARYIDLSSNAIDTLPYDAFAGLSQLRKLDLSSNMLTYVNSNIFADLAHLMVLNLADNDCQFAPDQCGGEPASTKVLKTCHCN